MALENLVGADKFLSALVPTNPVGADDKREGDDHVRGIKNTLRNSFPNVSGAVTATHAELSTVAGKANRAGDTFSGAVTFNATVTANAGVSAIGAGAGSTPLGLSNAAASAGHYWRFGPDSSGNSACILYNQDGTGVYIADGGTAWIAASDERYKTGFVEFAGALDKLSTLRAGTGRYIDDQPDMSRSFLIAQEVQAVLPEAVHDSGGVLGVAYADVIPLLVAAIKDLRAELQTVRELAGV